MPEPFLPMVFYLSSTFLRGTVIRAAFSKKTFLSAVLAACAAAFVVFFQNCSASPFVVDADVALQDNLLTFANKIDSQHLSSLLDANEIAMWKDSSGINIDNSPYFATEWSVILILDDTSDGDVISINSGPNSDEGKISIEGQQLKISSISSTASMYVALMPSKAFNKPTVIAARFGPKTNLMDILVDGSLQNLAVQATGTALDFSYISKSLNYNSAKVREVVYYNRSLSLAELNVMSRYLARKNGISTVVMDAKVLEEGQSTDSSNSPEYLAASAVINNKCVSCHNSAASNGDYRNLTASSAIQRQLITPGNLAASKLYLRMTGSKSFGGGENKNMPLSGTISTSEVEAIEKWILSIK